MTDKKKTRQGLKESAADNALEKPRSDKLALEIGRRISQARNGLGLSQQAVQTRSKMLDPDKIGVSRAALSLYETGTNKPGAREILLLCEVLSVSPNWLLFGSESPARALQPTTLFLAGDDLTISSRLALATMALNPSDRDSIANIVFSMLTGKLNDIKLAALMSMAHWMKEAIHKELLEHIGKDSEHLPLDQLIDKFIESSTDGCVTNWGTLRPVMTEEQIDNEEIPPPRSLKPTP